MLSSLRCPTRRGALSCGDGSQGERLYNWACIRLPYETGPEVAQWLLARLSLGDPAEVAYFRAFGPGTSSIEELARVAGMRWAIEEGFEDAKGVVGLDQYEVRKWNTCIPSCDGHLRWVRSEAL